MAETAKADNELQYFDVETGDKYEFRNKFLTA
jgi:hypothetical protein